MLYNRIGYILGLDGGYVGNSKGETTRATTHVFARVVVAK